MSRPQSEDTVELCIESFRLSFRRLDVPESDVTVTWDTDAGWARLRFLVPMTEPRRVVEHVERRRGTLTALRMLARWLGSRALRVKRGEAFAVVFEGDAETTG